MKTKQLLAVIIPLYENSHTIYFKANAFRVCSDYGGSVDDRMAVAIVAPV